jgi:hypothetical protein
VLATGTQITLFGDCVLSEDGTPSDCQLLDEALVDFQDALEMKGIASTPNASAPDSPGGETEYGKRISGR